MSEEDSEYSDGLEILTDEEDAAKDLELMKDILHTIKETKREDASSPDCPSKNVLGSSAHDVSSDAKPCDVVAIEDMQLDGFRLLLENLNQALEYNHILQNALIMKEVKLISLQRRLLAKKTRESEQVDLNKEKEDELKGDIGKYIVKFKAPYFKDNKNFAGYSVVPLDSIPKTSQYFEDKALEWKRPDLKELERAVKKFLAGRQFRSMIDSKGSTTENRTELLSKYKHDSTEASLSKLVPKNFDQITDWCLIASKLTKHHTPYECQKAWDIFLKPTLNRKNWSAKEKQHLKDLALEYNFEDWDTIAEKLGTSRSGYQCFHEFQDLISKIAEGDWSKDEEDLLIKLVKECSYGNRVLWHKVAYYFGTRSLSQIYRKWNLSAINKKHKSGSFSEYEDKVILSKMLKDNSKATLNLVAHLLNRMSCQIRYRYNQLLTSLTVKYGEWTLEEDLLLMKYVDMYGTKNWAKVAENIPSRDRIQARHRHRRIWLHLKKNPNMKLEEFHRQKRTVHKQRKKATMKYVMNIAGVQDQPADGGQPIKIGISSRDLVIRHEDLLEESTSGKRKKKRKKKKINTESQLIADRDGLEKTSLKAGLTSSDIGSLGYSYNATRRPSTSQQSAGVQTSKRSSGIKTLKPQVHPVSGLPSSSNTAEFPKPSTSQNPFGSSFWDPELVKVEQREKCSTYSQPQDRSNTTKKSAPKDDGSEPILNFYRQQLNYKGDPPQPKYVCKSGTDVKEMSSILRLKPYKYLDLKSAEWVYNMDNFDPYFLEVLEKAENRENDDDDSSASSNNLQRGTVLPPTIANCEGLYNLLSDIDFKERDVNNFDPSELATLWTAYDAEMWRAVNTWKDRLKSLFLWPLALSEIDMLSGKNTATVQGESVVAGELSESHAEDVNTVIKMSQQISDDIREAIGESDDADLTLEGENVLDEVGGLSLHNLNITTESGHNDDSPAITNPLNVFPEIKTEEETE